MKSPQEVESKVRALLCAELNARVTLASKRLPHLCTHNHRQPLDVRKRVEDEVNEAYNRITTGARLPVVQSMGLCMLGAESLETWPGTICEDPIDAQKCPYFDPKLDKAYIWTLFSNQIQDLEWLEANMPEVYSLLWSLDGKTLDLPWWKRLWFYVLKIRLEPLQNPPDITQLLPPPS